MELHYNEDERLIQESARKILTERVTQTARLATETSETGYDLALWREIVDLGWFASADDEPESLATLAILAEEMGRVVLATPYHRVVAAMLLIAGAPGKAAEDLHDEMAQGRLIAIPVDRQVTAEPYAGGLRISLPRQTLEWVNVAERLLVIAPSGSGQFAVCAVPVANEGVRIEPARALDHSRVGVLSLQNVACPADAIIASGLTAAQVERWRTAVQLLGAAEATAAADGALMLTVGYVKERKQFGRAIGSFQAIQHGLADAKASVDGAWLAVWEGVSGFTHGEAPDGAGPLACWLAERALQEAAVAGAQYHGGMGHIRDYPMQFYYRKAGATHGRLGTQWELLGGIARAHVDPFVEAKPG